MSNDTNKKHRIGMLSSVTSVIAVLAILIMVNLIAIRHSFQMDITQDKRFTLAPQTLQILDKLKAPVTVYSFYREIDEGYTEVKDLLDMYHFASSDFKYRFVDADKDPFLARRFSITTYNTIVLEQGDQFRKVADPTEHSLTNTLIKLIQGDQQHTVCFSTGHGELDIDKMESDGLLFLKQALEDANYRTQTINLMSMDVNPSDCKIMAVIGPVHEPVDEVIEWLRKFLLGGGRLLIALEPGSHGKFAALLSEFEIQFEDNVIIDPKGFQNVLQPVIEDFLPHKITSNFSSGLVFHVAGSVSPSNPTNELWSARNLAQSSTESYAKTDLASIEKGIVEYDPATDRQGPLSVAVACTNANYSGKPDEDTAMTRIVALGDADFMGNIFLQTFVAHQPFLLNIFHWLSDEEDLIAIPPRESESQPLLLSQTQLLIGFFVPVVVIPLAVAVFGIFRIISRRR